MIVLRQKETTINLEEKKNRNNSKVSLENDVFCITKNEFPGEKSPQSRPLFLNLPLTFGMTSDLLTTPRSEGQSLQRMLLSIVVTL